MLTGSTGAREFGQRAAEVRLTPVVAAGLARAALAGLEPPRVGHHPDCWWVALTLARLGPATAEAALARDLAIARFTPDRVAAAQGDIAAAPLGDLGWLLTLHAEVLRHRQPWSGALDRLALAAAARLRRWLTEARYPSRGSDEGNTALLLIQAHAWATAHDRPLALALSDKARAWYGSDRAAAAWEPDRDALLSPVLTEAHCLLRLLPEAEFGPWLAAFLPGLDAGEPATLFDPASGGDTRLDALNLSRAWSWRALGSRLPLAHVAHSAAERHLAAGLRRGAMPDAEPTLAPFALLALLPDSPLAG